MFKKIRIILFISVVIVLAVAVFFGPRIKDAYEFNKTAKAISTMPWSTGGTITFYQPACVLDPAGTSCPNCLMCTSKIGSLCAGYQEIQYVEPNSFGWVSTLCVPQGFPYLGGVPYIGGQFLGGGISDTFPWVIGVSQIPSR